MIKTKKLPNRWSAQLSKCQALDLEKDVFTWTNPHHIALFLKESVSRSTRSKTTAFVLAMSLLNSYITRAGTRLDAGQRIILEQAKDQLRLIFKRNLNG